MTPSYVVYDSFTYVVRESVLCGVWLIYICGAWLIYIRGAWLIFCFSRETNHIHSSEIHSDTVTVNDSFMSLTCIIYICGMTYLCVWHEIGTQEIHLYPGHDSFWCPLLRVEFLFLEFKFSRLPHIWVKDHTESHCITLQHTVTRCITLYHTEMRCNALHFTVSHCNARHGSTQQ